MTSFELKKLEAFSLKKCRWSIRSSVFLVLALTIFKLVLTNRSATWGRELEAIEQETARVKRDNLELQLKLKQNRGNLQELAVKAKEWGFVEKPEYVYLAPGKSVAQNQP